MAAVHPSITSHRIASHHIAWRGWTLFASLLELIRDHTLSAYTFLHYRVHVTPDLQRHVDVQNGKPMAEFGKVEMHAQLATSGMTNEKLPQETPQHAREPGAT